MTLQSVLLFDKEKMFAFMNLCKETSYAADAKNKLNIPNDGDITKYIQEQKYTVMVIYSRSTWNSV